MQDALKSGVHRDQEQRTLSAGHVRDLVETNERLRELIAELLLKNQTLRWKLAGSGLSESPYP